MIDIKQIRENPQGFKEGGRAKHFDVDIDRLLEVDSALKAAKNQLQEISTSKNRIGKSIPNLSGGEKDAALAQLSELKQQETNFNEDVKKLQPAFDELMMQVWQPADGDVPLGKDDTQNVEIRKEGQIRRFDFEHKDHVQLGQDLDIIDIERGVKLAGTRNYLLKGDGAMLHWAVLRFAMDYMAGEGDCPRSGPPLMNEEGGGGSRGRPAGWARYSRPRSCR